MNWRFVHSVWSLVWHPRKTSPGVQTLCISLFLMSAPAMASSSVLTANLSESDATCKQMNDLATVVQRQAGDIANMRYLLAEVLRTLDDLKANAAKTSAPTQQSPARPVQPGAR